MWCCVGQHRESVSVWCVGDVQKEVTKLLQSSASVVVREHLALGLQMVQPAGELACQPPKQHLEITRDFMPS